jgi:DNA-binding response OmpR family regulator
MDGFKVCCRLKENDETKDIPVIILTASGELSDRLKDFAWGLLTLSQRFQGEELLARVRTHLELRRLSAHLESSGLRNEPLSCAKARGAFSHLERNQQCPLHISQHRSMVE